MLWGGFQIRAPLPNSKLHEGAGFSRSAELEDDAAPIRSTSGTGAVEIRPHGQEFLIGPGTGQVPILASEFRYPLKITIGHQPENRPVSSGPIVGAEREKTAAPISGNVKTASKRSTSKQGPEIVEESLGRDHGIGEGGTGLSGQTGSAMFRKDKGF